MCDHLTCAECGDCPIIDRFIRKVEALITAIESRALEI